MLTSEQVVEYLIMIDLQRKGAENKLNVEGVSTLLDLQSDEKLRDIKMLDVLDYIHTQEEEIEELKTRVSELQDKDWYEKCIKQLEEQNDKLIKERDEIQKELETSVDYWKNEVFKKMEVKLTGVTKEKIQEIRKQVCDEIFKELQENTDYYFEERECNSPHSQLPYIWFNEIRFRKFLGQIEKGEK